jgi:glycerol-3-phosphate dehydrogenase (NAD(P)+)
MAKLTEGITVLGAGSWGTTLANLLAGKGYGVRLWVRDDELRRIIEDTGENATYLPGVRLSGNLSTASSLEDALKDCSLVLSAVPSHGIRKVFEGAREFIPAQVPVVSSSKGVEEGTHLTPTGIIREVLPGSGPIVVISGPTFAKEVSMGLPACITAASSSAEAASLVQGVFSTPTFRVYTNPDVRGVEFGGAVKNVIALASGISDGLELGTNARAALITRGLVEMSRLGKKLGADHGTFSGLSGLGDLVLTCTGELSRNRSVGLAIGRGQSLDEILKGMKMVAEGVRTSRAVRELAAAEGVEMPITDEVTRVLFEKRAPREAVMELMTRELKGE